MKKYLIGFTPKTSRIIPRILCRKFRHCCVIDIENMILIQIGADRVRFIKINMNIIQKLMRNNWVFVYCRDKQNKNTQFNFLNCVGFAKRVIGIKNPFILTPYALYKYLIK
jgi:hypothetical protein